MTITHARGPLRIGFAGGGSDVDPFCSKYGGRVLNATIAMYVHATVSPSTAMSAEFVSLDRNLHILLDSVDDTDAQLLPLHRNAYLYFSDQFLGGDRPKIKIQTYTDAPVGSGLGTSSTLVVTVIKALSRHFGVNLSSYEIAHASQVVEREMCMFSGGRQDQFSSTFGGFNFMEFEAETNVINQLRIPRETVLSLESNLLLYHMGTSRLSSQIIDDQAKTVEAGENDAWSAMVEIRDEAEIMKNHLLKKDLQGIVDSLRKGWENKKRTSSSVTSGLIELIYSTAMGAGALAGRVSGAGGGGFMLFYVPVQNRRKVMQALEAFDGYSSNVEFVDHGVEAWNE